MQTSFAEQLPDYSIGYDPSRDALQDARDAIKLAKATNRRILIEVGGDWCKWCHILDRFLNNNTEIKKQLHQTFVLLKVNVSDENRNSEFLKAFPRVKGYPHMFVAENDGKILSSNDIGEFYEKGSYSIKRFKTFFKQWTIEKKTTNA